MSLLKIDNGKEEKIDKRRKVERKRKFEAFFAPYVSSLLFIFHLSASAAKPFVLLPVSLGHSETSLKLA